VGRATSGVAQALTETYLEAACHCWWRRLLYLILRFMPAGIMGKADSNNVIRWIALFALGVLLLLRSVVGPYSDPRGDRHLHVGRAGRELELPAGYAGAVDLGPVVITASAHS